MLVGVHKVAMADVYGLIITDVVISFTYNCAVGPRCVCQRNTTVTSFRYSHQHHAYLLAYYAPAPRVGVTKR